LWAGLQAVDEKMTISGIRNCLNYCEIFYNVSVYYKCDPGLHNTTWWVACGLWAAGWRPMVYVEHGRVRLKPDGTR